ncbi:MAG: ABC-2 family transporter protein [Anaerolineales bacterium]|uniref:ABC transporter permease n=1 Tax=Candidatus Villigracilis vicinus TaxID=3140679 RepID=UPI003136BEA0|nr:ABC-2 family transporter protein [Anaerolineales bacterium]MBK9780732.1 ABC-2 family transporter protein [Anaerolineales bacterium]
MKRYFEFYIAKIRNAVLIQLQYPIANYFFIIGMIAEPVIYMVVWSTVARQQGGSVGGYTPGAFAAYYIVWTLVRNMNLVYTPYGWERRIRNGRLVINLLRPIHPLHEDVAYFAGAKVIEILLWLPLAVILSFIFKPDLHPTLLECVVFFVAIWLAYLIRTMTLSLLGMITFWTTRVSALYELYFAAELILSGRLVPLSLMPEWVQKLAWYFPFRWTFGFPIETLVGSMSVNELFGGLGMQLLWVVLGLGAVNIMWKAGIHRFSAVGG